jgi:hypothetical protein
VANGAAHVAWRDAAGAGTAALGTQLGSPRDLNLSSLPFARGQGIAQYTSDPRFIELVGDRIVAVTGRTNPRVGLGAARPLLSMSKQHPGGLRKILRSPEPRVAVETFHDIYSNAGLSWKHIATLRDRTSMPIVFNGILHHDARRHSSWESTP